MLFKHTLQVLTIAAPRSPHDNNRIDYVELTARHQFCWELVSAMPRPVYKVFFGWNPEGRESAVSGFRLGRISRKLRITPDGRSIR